jgi:hypothetical protein
VPRSIASRRPSSPAGRTSVTTVTLRHAVGRRYQAFVPARWRTGSAERRRSSFLTRSWNGVSHESGHAMTHQDLAPAAMRLWGCSATPADDTRRFDSRPGSSSGGSPTDGVLSVSRSLPRSGR